MLFVLVAADPFNPEGPEAETVDQSVNAPTWFGLDLDVVLPKPNYPLALYPQDHKYNGVGGVGGAGGVMLTPPNIVIPLNSIFYSSFINY